MAPEGKSWWELYTLDSSGHPKPTRLPFSSASSCVGTAGKGESRHPVQSRQQDSEVEGTWQLRFESNDCERAEICCCDVVRLPGVVLGHIVCPQLCQRLRISPVCGQVSSIVISLCCPKKSDCRPSAFSEVLGTNAVRSCIGSNGVRLAVPCTLTHRPFLFFPVLSPVLSVSGALWSDAEEIHECILLCLELSHAAQVECTFVRAYA